LKLTIRAMTLDDLNDIMEIEKTSFTIPWSMDAFKDELTSNDNAYYLVAVYDEKAVGYVGMWHVMDEGHITNIAVHPSHRRNKVGLSLLQTLIDKSKENSITKITLEVRESNSLAIELYSKLGFVSEGIRKHYYSDNNENAVIMWKYL